jgi:hypothetical protein
LTVPATETDEAKVNAVEDEQSEGEEDVVDAGDDDTALRDALSAFGGDTELELEGCDGGAEAFRTKHATKNPFIPSSSGETRTHC